MIFFVYSWWLHSHLNVMNMEPIELLLLHFFLRNIMLNMNLNVYWNNNAINGDLFLPFSNSETLEHIVIKNNLVTYCNKLFTPSRTFWHHIKVNYIIQIVTRWHINKYNYCKCYMYEKYHYKALRDRMVTKKCCGLNIYYNENVFNLHFVIY